MTYQKKCHVLINKSTTVLLITFGFLVGNAIFFIGFWLFSRSPRTWFFTGSLRDAFVFLLASAGFIGPIAAVLLLARSKVDSIKQGERPEEVEGRDVAIAVSYAFSAIPYLFAVAALLNGKIGFSVFMFLVYIFMAAYPLCALFRAFLTRLSLERWRSV